MRCLLVLSVACSATYAQGAADSARKRRLRAYSTVTKEWYEKQASLSDEQSAKLSEALQELTGISHSFWRQGSRNDYRLMEFVGERSGAGRVLLEGREGSSISSIWRRKTLRVLSDDQLSNIDRASRERAYFHTNIAADGLLAVVCDYIHLDLSLIHI